MKNIETILKDAGIELTEEQRTAVVKAVAENYKSLPDYQKQTDKLQAAQQKVSDAEEALKKFDGVDIDGFQKTIDEWKQKAQDAEKNAQAQLLKRDQMDWLKEKFDGMGVKSERTRKALIADILGADGLKWKEGQFLGFDDYIKLENEKDHFYDTPDETKAKETAPRFTEPGKPNGERAQRYEVPRVW